MTWAMVTLLAGLLGSVALFVHALSGLRRCSPDDRADQAGYGYLGAAAVLMALPCSTGYCLLVAEQDEPTGLAMAGVAVANLLTQPVALACIMVAVRRLWAGLSGNLGRYAPKPTDEHGAACRPDEFRGLSAYLITSGILGLLFGLGISVGCALPLAAFLLPHHLR